MKADVLDRAALRRAFRGCEIVFHAAGMVGSRPPELVWQVNALAPRIAVEAAAAEGVRRVVVTSSVAGIGPAPADRPGTEEDVYAGWGLGLTYPDAKHEGESEALAAGARLGVEVVVVNPSYVFGAPIDRSQPGETSTRTIGNYLRGRLPAVVDAQTNVVDVRDVAKGHLLAADKGRAGERYVLGGHDVQLGGADAPGGGAVRRAPPAAGAAARGGPARARGCRCLGRRGGGADGAELELLVGEGAARAGLPRPRAGPHAARDDRLVPGAVRRRHARRGRAVGDLAGGGRGAAGGAHGCAERRELAERYLGRELVGARP